MHFFTFSKLWSYSCSLFLVLLLCNCSKEEPLPLNEVTPKDEVAIGQAIDEAFLYHLDTLPDQYLLEEVDHPGIYSYLNRLCGQVQSSQTQLQLVSQDRPMRKPIIRVIERQGTTGAFVSPGGYLYVYTDLLKALDYEAELVPILAHLLSCSMHRFDLDKLEAHFSTNFLLDLAIGANVNAGYASTSTDVRAIVDHLADSPYQEQEVALLDELAEQTTCELDYDVQVYSTFFVQNNSQNLDWFNLFPRVISNSAYAAHLFNDVSDSLTCNGTMSMGNYPSFKTLIP